MEKKLSQMILDKKFHGERVDLNRFFRNQKLNVVLSGGHVCTEYHNCVAVQSGTQCERHALCYKSAGCILQFSLLLVLEARTSLHTFKRHSDRVQSVTHW